MFMKPSGATAPKVLVQLFNSSGRAASRSGECESTPNHLWGEIELNAAGFQVVTISTFRWPLNPAARLHNTFCGLDPLRALRTLITRRKSAVICAHLESAVLILLLRRLFLFRPKIVIWEIPWSPGWAYRETISRWAIPRADCSIVFSSNQIREVRRLYGTNVSVVFIPFCVDTEFFKPQAVRACESYIMSSGLDPGRDFSIIIEAARDLQIPVLIKANCAPDAFEGTPLDIKLISEHLSFSEYRDLYSHAIFVVVATKETVNASGVTSLLEAMAMGKPVIVSDNPALRDYLPPSDAGLVVPVGDVVALRSAMQKLLADPEAAKQMGMRARAFVERNFSPRAHFRIVGEVLNRTIEVATRP